MPFDTSSKRGISPRDGSHAPVPETVRGLLRAKHRYLEKVLLHQRHVPDWPNKVF